MQNPVFNNIFPPEQMGYIKRINALLPSVYGNCPKACVVTFGCQQNVSDSEKLKGMLFASGYTITEDMDEADFIIFNTCAVRGHAEDRVYGNIGNVKALKKAKPNLIAGICGCMAQQQSVADKIKKSYPYIDLCFGTQMFHRLPEFIYKRLTGGKRVFELDLPNDPIVEEIPLKRDRLETGWLPIMYGCNNFCSYCIVPHVRGRERSRKPDVILDEAKTLVKEGYKLITLLGQNVNSYGKNCDFDVNFAELIRRIDKIEGNFKFDFMTSHPRDCSFELIDVLSQSKHFCGHLHLPVQSGNNRILKEMNRHYTREHYLELIAYAKKKIPNVDITTDIIVGFPGETYEEFLDTLSLVKEVRYGSMFTFIYSPRKGTPAAEMPDPVSKEEKTKWFLELLKVQETITAENQQ